MTILSIHTHRIELRQPNRRDGAILMKAVTPPADTRFATAFYGARTTSWSSSCAGVFSDHRRRRGRPVWIHLDEADAATVLALEQRGEPASKHVDDEPLRGEWLP